MVKKIKPKFEAGNQSAPTGREKRIQRFFAVVQGVVDNLNAQFEGGGSQLCISKGENVGPDCFSINLSDVEQVHIAPNSTGFGFGCCYVRLDSPDGSIKDKTFQNIKNLENRLADVLIEWMSPDAKAEAKRAIRAYEDQDRINAAFSPLNWPETDIGATKPFL